MVSTRAVTVEQYLAELPPERRAVVSALRDLINRNIPKGYVESLAWGMIGWGIPLSRYPNTYNGQPLSYLALAAQKNNFALYSMCAYMSPKIEAWLREEFGKAGLELDMGKSCIRFKSLGEIPQSAVAGLAAAMTVEDYIERYEAIRAGSTGEPRASGRTAAPVAKPPARKPAKGAPAPRKAAKRK